MGGNAKTSLVVAIADAAEHLDETLQSIQFGQRAMRVQTKARVNQSTGKDLLNADLLKRLGSMDIATCVVDANLLAKEEELRKIQEALAVRRLPLLCYTRLDPFCGWGIAHTAVSVFGSLISFCHTSALPIWHHERIGRNNLEKIRRSMPDFQ